MKIAVLNFSGNVGKSTLVAHMLKPRIEEAKIFSIESINMGVEADGIADVEKIKGKKFGDLVDEIMLLDAAIVDVGASNVEDFLKLMQQFDGSHEEFDYFIVPTMKEKKVQADTVNTIRALKAIGVDRKRIRLVFNKVEIDDTPDDDFAALFGLAQTEKSFVLNDKCIVYSNEVYERLKPLSKTLGDVSQDSTDYRAALRAAADDVEKEKCIAMIAIKRLATSANKNLDTVYQNLFK